MPAKGSDKLVYDVRASDGAQACVVAVSADSTLLDLYLALLAAFDWRGDYGIAERAYRISFPGNGGGRTYTDGRGSRTRLRRVLTAGARFACAADDPRLILDCEVAGEYEVRSRRHHPKVLDVGGDEDDAKIATWRAQAAVRRDFREPVRYREPPRSRQPLAPEYLHGMFAAIVAGPLVMPSAWLPLLLATDQFDTIEHVQQASEATMNSYNAVAHGIHEAPERFIRETARMLEADADGSALEAWVRGFINGTALGDAEWREALADPELRQHFMPIASVHDMYSHPAKREWLKDADLRSKLSQACPIAAVEIAAFWRRRVVPNVIPFRRRK